MPPAIRLKQALKSPTKQVRSKTRSWLTAAQEEQHSLASLSLMMAMTSTLWAIT